MAAPSLRHKFNSPLPDGPNNSLIRPSNWNDEHDLILPSDAVVVGRADGEGPGEAQVLDADDLAAILGDYILADGDKGDITVSGSGAVWTLDAGVPETKNFTPAGSGAVTRTIQSKLRLTCDVMDFGAVQDSATDNTAAFNLALATGRSVVVPDDGSGDYYRVDGPLVFQSNQALIGPESRPTIKLGSAANALLLGLSGLSDVLVASLTIDGNKSVTPSSYVAQLTNATRCHVQNIRFIDAPSLSIGSVILTGTANGCSVKYCQFEDAEGTAIGLSGASVVNNDIVGNFFEDCGGFGIRVGEGANKNLFQGNKTFSNGIELIGVTYDCYDNRIISNHAEGTGDAGISVTGKYNTVQGNTCIGNYGSGITLWGSHNTCVGNVCRNNNQQAVTPQGGITVYPAYGGTGQYNTVIGNFCDDDQAVKTQTYGVNIKDTSYYSAWGSGQAVTAGAYRLNGLNIYRAATSGTTGSTAPVHTSGTVSDDAVDWLYVNSFVTAAESRYNFVGFNTVPRFVTAATHDAGNWLYNTRAQQEAFDFQTGPMRVNGPASSWTSLSDLSVGNGTGNHGIAVTSSSSGLGRIAFGDSALAGAVEYDHATDELSLFGGGAKRIRMQTGALFPETTDSMSLGIAASKRFLSLNLSVAGVINWAGGGITITESSDSLLFQGASAYDFYSAVQVRYGFGSGAMVLGADVNAATLTTSVRKLGRITAPSYDTAQANSFLLGADNDGTNNNVFFGGTPGASNMAATLLSFVTAASVGTAGGTLRATIDASGHLNILGGNIKINSAGALDWGAGNATITHSTGLLTSNVPFAVPDDAYNATNWNGSVNVPTKNAVRDQFEAEPSASRTLTNKTIAIGSNTVSGSVSDFNTALTGADFYTTGGTDVAVADGGTGASTARAACQNLQADHLAAHSAVTGSAHTGTTSETVLATYNIPAGGLGNNGKAVVKFDVSSMTSSANNKTLRVRLGGLAGTIIGAVAWTTKTTGFQVVEIENVNAANSQKGITYGERGTDGVWQTNNRHTAAVNTASAQDIVITAQLANSGETLTLDRYSVEILAAA